MCGLAAEHLLPGERRDIDLAPVDLLGEGGRGGVDQSQPRAICRNPVPIRHAHTGRGPIPSEDDIAVEVDLSEIRQKAVIRLVHPHVGKLELLQDIGDPTLAEAFPGERIDTALAEQRPHRHLESPGVRSGNDAANVVLRQLKELARLVDGELQARLAFLRSMGAAEKCVAEDFGGPAGALGAGAGREMRSCRLGSRLRMVGHVPTLPDRCSSLGRSGPQPS